MENWLLSGLGIMAIGIGVVFSFLILLVLSMNLKYLILKTFFPKSLLEEKVSVISGEAEVAVAIAAVKNFIKTK